MAEKLFPDDKVIVTEYFDVHQDWEIPIPGLFIIASTKDRISLDEFNEQEAAEFFNLVRKLRKGMRDVLGIKNVYFWQDESTHHNLFHLWMFPRYEWMEQFGQKIQSIRPIINHAKETMVNEKVIKEVKAAVEKMKEYMKNHDQK
jgi:hypothetical protein